MPQFIDYDTISDKLYFLGNSIYLNFVVKLSKKDKEGNRKHYHSEYEYNSSYLNTRHGYTIKRDFDYYFTIENHSLGIYIQIRMENMLRLQTVLKHVASILMEEKIWAIKNAKLILKGTIEPIQIPLPMDKWISFEPTVIQYDNGQFAKGVRITYSQVDLFSDINIDQYMGLTYLLSTFNMYQSAISLINYLGWNDYGTNLITFINDQNNDEAINSGVSSPTGRTVQKKQKSFFDLD